MFMDITGNDLLDQNVDLACVEIRLRCSWILLVLIYLIKILVVACANVMIQVFMDITGIDLFDQNVDLEHA